MSLIYLRVSNLTFGGGDPTMATLQAELVARHGWLSPETYGLVYGLARLTAQALQSFECFDSRDVPGQFQA